MIKFNIRPLDNFYCLFTVSDANERRRSMYSLRIKSMTDKTQPDGNLRQLFSAQARASLLRFGYHFLALLSISTSPVVKTGVVICLDVVCFVQCHERYHFKSISSLQFNTQIVRETCWLEN